MNISIVVAMAENHVIGKDNALPWRLPEDLKYFKRVTMGHPIVMGRKTFESIGRPLPGRLNIVVSRGKDWHADGVVHACSLEEGFDLAEQEAKTKNVDQIMLVGGAQLYRQAFSRCTRLYLTQVHAEIEGDAFFPEFDRKQWTQISRQDYPSDAVNPYPYSFIVLDRKA